jgi:tetratricopeptide (TPR) repeat protein
LSWEGSEGFQQKALEAMDWFLKARALNSYHPYPLIRYGMCLDWLERYREAEGYFKEADRLDPNGFYTAAHLGWHYFQVGDYVRSRNWFERSMSIFWHDNPISQAYLQILKSKIPPASPQ